MFRVGARARRGGRGGARGLLLVTLVGTAAPHTHTHTQPLNACPPPCLAASLPTGLEKVLPLHESSSVFVRVDSSNMFLWRALITGPEDTPYSGGCFIFDMYFPLNYPAVPLQARAPQLPRRPAALQLRMPGLGCCLCVVAGGLVAATHARGGGLEMLGAGG